MKLIHFKSLDTLRFIAFFLVFWQHGFSNSVNLNFLNEGDLLEQIKNTGVLGVHIFFVLSGFLITFLLFKEQQTNGKINLWYFYVRRILRIWPLYYLILILGFFVLPSLNSAYEYCPNFLLDFIFLNNFHTPTCNTPSTSMLWSIAIEEQFYLFWPLIIIVTNYNKKLILYFSTTVFLISAIYSYLNPIDYYFSTLGNLNYLMAGCIGGMYFGGFNKYKHHLIFKKITFLVVGLSYTLIYLQNSKLILFLSPIYFVYIILFLVINESSYNSYNVLSKLGKYTYGMYVYHGAIIVLIKILLDYFGYSYKENSLTHIFLGLISLLLTITVSVLSYKFFEIKFLKLKTKFSMIKTRN